MPGPTEEDHSRLEDHTVLFRDLLLGFVKIHILYHASVGPIYGAGITEELKSHGYDLSPGTLYPLLHSFEQNGFLVREDQVVNGKVRKYYTITHLGLKALAGARVRLDELVNEVKESEPAPS